MHLFQLILPGHASAERRTVPKGGGLCEHCARYPVSKYIAAHINHGKSKTCGVTYANTSNTHMCAYLFNKVRASVPRAPREFPFLNEYIGLSRVLACVCVWCRCARSPPYEIRDVVRFASVPYTMSRLCVCAHSFAREHSHG